MKPKFWEGSGEHHALNSIVLIFTAHNVVGVTNYLLEFSQEFNTFFSSKWFLLIGKLTKTFFTCDRNKEVGIKKLLDSISVYPGVILSQDTIGIGSQLSCTVVQYCFVYMLSIPDSEWWRYQVIKYVI